MLQITAQLPFSAKSCAPPPKKPSTRDREYLRSPEVKAMIRAAKKVGRPIKWDNIMASGMEQLSY